VLTVTAEAGNTFLTVDHTAGNTTLMGNALNAAVPDNFVARIDIRNPTAGNITFNFLGTVKPIHLYGGVWGFGSPLNTVNVGNKPMRGMADIQADLTLDNAPFYNQLTVDDFFDPSGFPRDVTLRTVSLAGGVDNYGAISGLGANVYYKYADTGGPAGPVTLWTPQLGGANVSALSAVRPIQIFGGPPDTLYASAGPNVWNFTGFNTGVLTSPSLPAGVTFFGVGTHVGGPGDNRFVFPQNGALVTGDLHGGGGTNTLDYRGYSTTVTVNLLLNSATGVLGNVFNIQDVYGGTGGWATGQYNVIVGDGQSHHFYGGDGRDNLLIAESGPSTLTGGTASATCENLLVGGLTVWDNFPPALAAIMATWTNPNWTFAMRVNLLTTGGGWLDPNFFVVNNGGGNTLSTPGGSMGAHTVFFWIGGAPDVITPLAGDVVLVI
jgi:hypothetical protein